MRRCVGERQRSDRLLPGSTNPVLRSFLATIQVQRSRKNPDDASPFDSSEPGLMRATPVCMEFSELSPHERPLPSTIDLNVEHIDNLIERATSHQIDRLVAAAVLQNLSSSPKSGAS